MTKEEQKKAKMYIYSTIIWITLIWLKIDFERALVDCKTEILNIYSIENNSKNFTLAECLYYGSTYYVVYEVFGRKEIIVPTEDTYIYRTLSADEQAYIEQDINEFGEMIEARLYVPNGTVIKNFDMEWEEVTREYEIRN